MKNRTNLLKIFQANIVIFPDTVPRPFCSFIRKLSVIHVYTGPVSAAIHCGLYKL